MRILALLAIIIASERHDQKAEIEGGKLAIWTM